MGLLALPDQHAACQQNTAARGPFTPIAAPKRHQTQSGTRASLAEHLKDGLLQSTQSSRRAVETASVVCWSPARCFQEASPASLSGSQHRGSPTKVIQGQMLCGQAREQKLL